MLTDRSFMFPPIHIPYRIGETARTSQAPGTVRSKPRRIRHNLLVLFASLSLWGAASHAQAECRVVLPNSVEVDALEVHLPPWNPPSFDPNVPDGTVLFSGTGDASGEGGQLRCDSPVGFTVFGGSTPETGKFNTYATSVAGVGYRIRGGINESQWWPQHADWGTNTMLDLSPPSEFTLELVKIGPITASGKLTGQVGYTAVPKHNKIYRRVYLTGSVAIKPTVPSCVVKTPSINVPFGKVSFHEISSNGGASKTVPFNIQLQCSGGTQGAVTNMYMTMTDAAQPANRSDTLSLARSSTATGFGVQILRDNGATLVKYGPDSSQTGNPNQWKVGQFGNEGVDVPLSARLVRTGSSVTGGSVNAAATFTMSYQ